MASRRQEGWVTRDGKEEEEEETEHESERGDEAISRYNQLIDNFHQERNIIYEYEALVAPKQAILHALQWNER